MQCDSETLKMLCMRLAVIQLRPLEIDMEPSALRRPGTALLGCLLAIDKWKWFCYKIRGWRLCIARITIRWSGCGTKGRHHNAPWALFVRATTTQRWRDNSVIRKTRRLCLKICVKFFYCLALPSIQNPPTLSHPRSRSSLTQVPQTTNNLSQ